MSNNRDKILDILKGVGIAAVVLGHTGTPANPFVYLFHIPLFFFASGYFFKDSALEKPGLFLWKRIKGLYFPYVAAGLVALLLHNWLVTIHLYSVAANVPVGYLSASELGRLALDTILFRHTELLLAPLWFLPVLFTVNLLFFAVRSISRRLGGKEQATLFLMVTALFALGLELLSHGVASPWLFPISLLATTCYALGYWAKTYKALITLSWQGAAGCLLLLLMSLPFSIQLDLHSGSTGSPGYFFLGAMAGIYLCWYLSSVLARWPVATWIGVLVGQASLYVLTLHVLAFKAVAVLEIAAYHMPIQRLADFTIPVGSHAPWRLAYPVIGVVLPAAICFAVQRIQAKRARVL